MKWSLLVLVLSGLMVVAGCMESKEDGDKDTGLPDALSGEVLADIDSPDITQPELSQDDTGLDPPIDAASDAVGDALSDSLEDASVEVCCVEGKVDYYFAPEGDCQGPEFATVEDISFCQEVCCKVGAVDKLVGAGTCQAAGGNQVPVDNCEAPPTECTSDADCDDSNECTDDDCTASECVYKLLSGALCSDGDECTENDYCSAGFCQPGEPSEECKP